LLKSKSSFKIISAFTRCTLA